MSCNYTFNMPDGTEVTVDEKTFKQMQASGQLSHVTSIKTDGTLASIERAHEQAMAAQTNRSLRQSAGAFFSNQATRYIDKYFNVDKWVDTISGVDEVGKMSLKTALSRVTTMANFSEKQINARGQEAADFAKRADVKGVDQDEKKVAVFSNWAQLSTIEDATKRLIAQMMPDTKGPTAQKENIISQTRPARTCWSHRSISTTTNSPSPTQRRSMKSLQRWVYQKAISSDCPQAIWSKTPRRL
jgi:hypothetical protein